MQEHYDAVGISFPRIILQRIDSERGDVSRSRYMMRLLEKALQTSIFPDPQSAETREANGGDPTD